MGMYPIFEPGQKVFASDSFNDDWESLDREIWVCTLVNS